MTINSLIDKFLWLRKWNSFQHPVSYNKQFHIQATDCVYTDFLV